MREFVMLAEAKGNLNRDFYASDKLDGMRAIWLPETHGRIMGWCPDRSNGLWSRGGKVINAPQWFLDTLPRFRLDGELFTESYNKTMSVCRSFADKGWADVRYNVFDIPDAFYSMGLCKKPAFFFQGSNETQLNFIEVVERLRLLSASGGLGKYTVALDQKLVRSLDEIHVEYNRALLQGHEGLMLRTVYSKWEPKRSQALLKLKPSHDAEAVIIDVTPGKGKYEGLIGAFVVEWNGKRFELSGMTDAERSESKEHWVGSTVTFRYDALTPLGVPRFARYLRIWRGL